MRFLINNGKIFEDFQPFTEFLIKTERHLEQYIITHFMFYCTYNDGMTVQLDEVTQKVSNIEVKVYIDD